MKIRTTRTRWAGVYRYILSGVIEENSRKPALRAVKKALKKKRNKVIVDFSGLHFPKEEKIYDYRHLLVIVCIFSEIAGPSVRGDVALLCEKTNEVIRDLLRNPPVRIHTTVRAAIDDVKRRV